MAENINYFTREGSAAVSSPEDVTAIVKGLRTKVSASKRAGENLVEAAAYATHAAIRVSEDWNPTEWSKQTGAARVTVYLWRRMGIALMDLGVEPKTPEWTALVGKAAATKTPVSWVLDGLGIDGKGEESSRGTTNSGNFKPGKANIAPTREMLDEALSVLFERDENGVLQPEKSRPAAEVKRAVAEIRGESVEDQTSGANEGDATDTVTDPRDVGSRCKVAAEYLATFLSELSPEQFAEIDGTLGKVFKAAKVHKDAAKAASAA